MFQTLDVMISFGVVFLILSMVHKYFLSIVKRLCRIKAKVISETMEDFLGRDIYTNLVPFIEKKSQDPGSLDNIGGVCNLKGVEKGLRQLDKKSLKEAVNSLKSFLDNATPGKDIKEFGLDIKGSSLNDVRDRLDIIEDRIDAVYGVVANKIDDAYESRMRMWNFFWGVILVFMLNADFFDIYNSLSMQSLSRERLVVKAEMINEQTMDIAAAIRKDEEKKAEIGEDVEKAGQDIQELKWQLEEAGLHMGWTQPQLSRLFELPEREECRGKNWPGLKCWFAVFTRIVSKLFGFIISGLLVSFGAPFWHDLLSSLSGINRILKSRENGKDKKTHKHE